MKRLALAALLGALLGLWAGLWSPLRHGAAVDKPAPSTTLVRDSARVSLDTAHARHDTVVRWLARAPADTLGPILRALARRPPLILRDTLYLPLDTAMAGDSGSPEPCDLSVSCQEARRLLARDTSWSLLADSIRWELRIQSARSDSLSDRLGTCLAEKNESYGRGFLHGAGTGFVVCKAIDAAIQFFF